MLRQGLAKTLFQETYGRTPWHSSRGEKGKPAWPFLDLLLAQKRLSYLDYALTHRLLRSSPDAGQEVALFLCHLIIAAKSGHLCIRITEEGLHPFRRATMAE